MEEKCDKEAETLYTNISKSASNSSTNLSPSTSTFDPRLSKLDSGMTSLNDEKAWKRFDESDNFSSDEDSTKNINFIYDNLGSTVNKFLSYAAIPLQFIDKFRFKDPWSKGVRTRML